MRRYNGETVRINGDYNAVDAASNVIRRFVMQRANELLISGKSITETSE